MGFDPVKEGVIELERTLGEFRCHGSRGELQASVNRRHQISSQADNHYVNFQADICEAGESYRSSTTGLDIKILSFGRASASGRAPATREGGQSETGTRIVCEAMDRRALAPGVQFSSGAYRLRLGPGVWALGWCQRQRKRNGGRGLRSRRESD